MTKTEGTLVLKFMEGFTLLLALRSLAMVPQHMQTEAMNTTGLQLGAQVRKFCAQMGMTVEELNHRFGESAVNMMLELHGLVVVKSDAPAPTAPPSNTVH